MTAFADHGADGNGEPPTIVLRAGSAGSNTAADHIEAARLALAQLPRRLRRRVLIRADSGGGTHGFLEWLTARSRRLHYSVGMTITEDMQDAVLQVPADSWTPAYDGDGQVRDGAWVADITGMLDLSSWPAGMRVIVRKERPHPGAQLRLTDIDGHRFTAFATDAKRGQLADLELPPGPLRGPDPRRERHRAAEPSLKGFAQNQLWCEIVALACELLAWTQILALTGTARRWEPKRLRLRLFSVAGRLARGGRRLRLRLAGRWPGPARSPPPLPGCRPCRPADPVGTNRRQERSNPRGPWNPAHPARQPGSQTRPAPGNHHQPNSSDQHVRHAKDRGLGLCLSGIVRGNIS